MTNIYTPYLMTVAEIIEETYDTKTMKLLFKDEAVAKSFTFKAVNSACIRRSAKASPPSASHPPRPNRVTLNAVSASPAG